MSVDVMHEQGRTKKTKSKGLLRYEQKRGSLQAQHQFQQKKTFTKWMNSYLQKVHVEVDDIFVDLADGQHLLKLLAMISGEKLPKPTNGKMRIHKFENVNKSLDFLRTKLRLESIGAEDIVDGNATLILGLLWTIIRRFQIQEITFMGDERNAEIKSADEALLSWAQRAVQDFPGLDVKDFSSSWQTGLGFNALILAHEPDLFDYNSLLNNSNIDNLNHAFDIAFEEFDIPRLLDAEDIDTPRPDAKSVMTYIAACYHKFDKLKNEGKWGHIARIVKRILAADKKNQTATAVPIETLEWIKDTLEKLEEEDVSQILDNLEDCRNSDNISKRKEDKQSEWEELLHLMKNHKPSLNQIVSAMFVSRQMDTALASIKQLKEDLSSINTGDHLEEVLQLLNKHDLDTRVSSLQEEIGRLQQAVTNITLKNPNKTEVLNNMLTQLSESYKELEATSDVRKSRLEEAKEFYQIVEDLKDDETWLLHKQIVCNACIITQNLQGALDLQQNHQVLLDQIEARKIQSDQLTAIAQQFLDQKQVKPKIQQYLNRRKLIWDRLERLAEERTNQLHNVVKAYKSFALELEADPTCWLNDFYEVRNNSEKWTDEQDAVNCFQITCDKAEHGLLEEISLLDKPVFGFSSWDVFRTRFEVEFVPLKKLIEAALCQANVIKDNHPSQSQTVDLRLNKIKDLCIQVDKKTKERELRTEKYLPVRNKTQSIMEMLSPQY